MKIKRRLFLIVFSLFFANFADAFTVEKYNLEWDILSDWTINVHEDIAVDFSDWALHWIERILSRKYTVLDTIFQVFYDNINVINDNFTTYNDYWWDTIVRIWDKDILLDWKHSYDINYSTYWLIKSFSWMWYSELYWNVIWYEWDAPIHSPKIIINLPKAYSWFTDEDFIISLWFNQYHNIHEFPWEFLWDENKIYINYTWVLNRYQWITLSVKFPKDYFEFDHEKQASIFYDYTRAFKIPLVTLTWVVHKNWYIDFNETFNVDWYKPVYYFWWKLPFRFNSDYNPYLIYLSGLQVNWVNISHSNYDINKYDQSFDLRDIASSGDLSIDYSMYWLIRNFTWEDEEWTNKLYLPLPLFELDQTPEDINLALQFPESEFPNVCSWIYKEDIEFLVWWNPYTIEEFYDNWWELWCENNTLYLKWKWIFAWSSDFIWVSLIDFWFELDEKLLDALGNLWNWEFYFNDDINRQSILLLLWTILTTWWLMTLMKRRYKLYWKDKLKYIVEYAAPKWMDAPEAWALIDDVINWKDITALIYQWAAAWYVQILKNPRNKKRFYIKKIKYLPSNSKEYQLKFFNKLFERNDEFYFPWAISSYWEYSEFKKVISTAKSWLTTYIDSQDWYNTKLDSVKSEKKSFRSTNKHLVWWTAFLSVIFFNIFVATINSYLKPVWTWNILFWFIWFILILNSYRFKEKNVYTEKGDELLKQIKWYKDFLKKVDKDKFKVLTDEDPLFVEKALPYAVVFWLDTKFIKYITPEDVQWLGWDIDVLEDSLSYISEAVNTYWVAPYYYSPYSSSSSSSWSSGSSYSSYSSSSWFSSGSSFGGWHSSWWGWWGWGGRWW